MSYLPKSTRRITEIWIHCSATAPTHDVRVSDLRRWHKKRGWNDVGYHGAIIRDGRFQRGRDVSAAGAHAFRHNRNSIGICMIGGLGKDNRPAPDFTRAQWRTLKAVVAELQKQYPDAVVRGHNELGGKACPSFVVADWMRDGTVTPVA